MTFEQIRQKTHELHIKTRRTLLGGIATSLLMIVVSGYGVTHAGGAALRAVFALAIAWSLAGQYFLNRGMQSRTPPEDAGLRTGILSYRREVERRRYLSGRFLIWSLGPVVLVIAALIVLIAGFGIRSRGMLPGEALRNMIPFLVLLVAWLVSVFVLRLRDRRQLQREIDDLNAIEKANGA